MYTMAWFNSNFITVIRKFVMVWVKLSLRKYGALGFSNFHLDLLEKKPCN